MLGVCAGATRGLGGTEVGRLLWSCEEGRRGEDATEVGGCSTGAIVRTPRGARRLHLPVRSGGRAGGAGRWGWGFVGALHSGL